MKADGSEMAKLTKSPGEYISGETQLVWSPDRTKIAFLFGAYPRQQIYTINANGTNLNFLTNNPNNEVYNVKLFWSPANSSIAYYYNKPGDLAGEQQDIYLLGINRETAKNLTQKTRNYDELSCSPGDQLIAFVAGELNNQKLYTINADGDQLNQLAPRLEPSGISELAWSSDSQ